MKQRMENSYEEGVAIHSAPKVYSGVGADIVMESISPTIEESSFEIQPGKGSGALAVTYRTRLAQARKMRELTPRHIPTLGSKEGIAEGTDFPVACTCRPRLRHSRRQTVGCPPHYQ
jgi:hypothetical protein